MSETLWQRLLRGVRRLRQRSDWAELLGPDWADGIMDVAITDRFHAKQGRSTGRWVIHSGEKRLAVYLKRHSRLSWWRGLLATVWPHAGWSPALQEARKLDWARAQGLPVPAVVAAGEFVGPWGRLRSFLAVEELAGMLPLHEAIPLAAGRLGPKAFARWKCGLSAEVARLARALHDRGYYHKDFYLCHFYVPRAATEQVVMEWPGNVWVIDLHRLAHHPWTGTFWKVKDLAQLLYSSDVAGVTVRDRLRFWRSYLGRRTSRGLWLRWLVSLKGQRYRRHNDKHRLQLRASRDKP